MTNHPGIRAALIAAAGTLALMAAACSANSTTATGGQPGASASPAASTAAGEGGTGTNGDAGTSTSATPRTNTTPRSSSTPASGPQIVAFKVSQQPACPVVGTPDAPFSAPGQDIILSWKVTGATKVSLSVDGPGVYRSDYGQQDTQQLSFGCDTSQPQSKHTYLLTVTGGGVTKTQTLNVSIPSKP